MATQRLIYSLFFVVFLSGCGVIFKGTTQNINVNVTPAGSTINVDGQSYTSPTVITLARNNNYVVTISKDGYETQQVRINKKISGGIVLLDILVSYTLIPILIDAATGAWYNLKPDQITVTLRSNQTGVIGDVPIKMSVIGRNLKISSPKPVHIQISEE